MRIAEDLATLSKVKGRFAGTQGERDMLKVVREEVADEPSVRVDGFVAYTASEVVLAIHAGLLLICGLLGLIFSTSQGILGVVSITCALTTLSLLSESTGHFSLLRFILPKQASYNLVWKKEASDPLGVLVISAPLDAPRWRVDPPQWWRRPLIAVIIASMVITVLLTLLALAEPWGRPTQGMYGVALGILAMTVGLGAYIHRYAGGGPQDASGIAGLLDFIRRIGEVPIHRLNTYVVFTGCGHAFQNGMSAFLAMHQHEFIEPVLVIALDDPGRGPVHGIVSEGTVFSKGHFPTGPALVERLRWNGVEIGFLDKAGNTNARAATAAGFRAIAIGGGRGVSSAENIAFSVEISEGIAHLFADDLRRSKKAQEARST